MIFPDGKMAMLFKRLLPFLFIGWISLVYALYFLQFKDLAIGVLRALIGVVGRIV